METINVRLNSPGGAVFDGIAIYNSLAQHKAKVVATVEGIAASIASVILMAADDIRIVEGAHVMIHKPWSFAIGDAEAMRKEADILDKLESGILDIYEARTGADRKQLADWVAAETWFGAKEAVDAGFADEMVPAKKKEKKAAHARSASGDASLITGDGLINLYYGLKSAYARNGVFILNRSTIAAIRKLKDSQGQYIWMPGLANGVPNTILGSTYVEMPDMPNIGAGACPVAFGDFRRGYAIVDRIGMSFQPDYTTGADDGVVVFRARKRGGGGVRQAEAYKKLKIAAS